MPAIVPLYQLTVLDSAIRQLRDTYADMTMAQALVLLAVVLKPGVTQTELRETTGLSDASVSRICAILGPYGNRGTPPLGLIEFRPMPNDRRMSAMHLTRKGLTLAGKLAKMMQGARDVSSDEER